MSYLSWETVGFLAGALTTFGYIPQIYRLLRIKKAECISYQAFGILGAGVLCWFVYGIDVKVWPVVVANGLTFLFICWILILSVKYKLQK